MNEPRCVFGSRRKGSRGLSLAELVAYCALAAVLAGSAWSAFASVFRYQAGLDVGADLMEAAVLQRRWVVEGLNDPPALAAAWRSRSMSWDQLRDRAPPAAFEALEAFLAKRREAAEDVLDLSTIPLTYRNDREFARNPRAVKDPLNARSGDGMFDVGPERWR